MMYLTKKRIAKLFKPSKNIEAKKIILFNSLDNIKKISKTPDDIIHNLIKWSFKYHGVFPNSKDVVSRSIKDNDITLKNGSGVKHMNSAYLYFKNNKTVFNLTSESHDYGDALTAVKNMIDAMKTGKWFFKQNPLHAFGHYAKPINYRVALHLINDVKKTTDQILYMNDKGRIQRINNFEEKYESAEAKNTIKA